MDDKIPSVSNLQAEKSQRDEFKTTIYKVVLKKCIEKIQYTNRNTDQTFVIFEVPKLLIGHPSYDMRSCILYIISKLNAENYLLEFIEPFYLYIDWGTPTTKKKNPIPEGNIKEQTQKILKLFPNASKVEYVYQDQSKSTIKKR